MLRPVIKIKSELHFGRILQPNCNQNQIMFVETILMCRPFVVDFRLISQGMRNLILLGVAFVFTTGGCVLCALSKQPTVFWCTQVLSMSMCTRILDVYAQDRYIVFMFEIFMCNWGLYLSSTSMHCASTLCISKYRMI